MKEEKSRQFNMSTCLITIFQTLSHNLSIIFDRTQFNNKEIKTLGDGFNFVVFGRPKNEAH